ncbi:MAG: hypothetical protein Q8R82_09965 [Hyphomonadaceae bacterium]|nr:hypothetical protein [Hyphomonadaceae bacterium]
MSYLDTNLSALLASVLNDLDAASGASAQRMSKPELLARIHNALSSGPDVSRLTSSPPQIIAAIHNVVSSGADVSAKTSTVPQMLAAIRNALSDAADISHLRVSEGALWDAAMALVAATNDVVDLRPAVLALSPVVMFDPSDLTTMFQETTGASATIPAVVDSPVGSILNIGTAGGYATASADANRPLLRLSGGLYYLDFDGTNDCLVFAHGGSITNPVDRLSAIRQSTWTSADRIFTGSSSGRILKQVTASPQLNMENGAELTLSPGLAVATPGVITERFNGVTSAIALNANAYVTGSGGLNAAANLYIASETNSTRWSDIDLFGFVQFHAAQIDASITTVRTWLAAKAGVTL